MENVGAFRRHIWDMIEMVGLVLIVFGVSIVAGLGFALILGGIFAVALSQAAARPRARRGS